MMKKAFTLIELLVSIGILAMILSFASVIFRVTINSHRTAYANAEIMRKLHAITDQLNSDFKGAIPTHPSKIDIEDAGSVYADRIVLFANGDFQSIRQYWYVKSDGTEALKTVSGNVASILYSQAADAFAEVDPNTDPFTGDPREKILVRRQTILTSDSSLIDVNSSSLGEFYKSSLSESDLDPNLDVDALIVRPFLDIHSPEDLMMYMAKGVDNFTIEMFNGTDGTGRINWLRSEADNIYTKALKFTFTLYDSKGVIKGGRTFTHIVYLGE